MVRGLDTFRKYFEAFPDNYIIIGGTACDIIIDAAGFTPRTTKDIDIILVVEALTSEFVKQFWSFIQDGNYEQREKSEDERKYYRFLKPENKDFPYQIEMFSKIPDLLDIEEDAHLTPIPVDDDLSSLSAILMNEDYYAYTIEHSTEEDGIHRANTEALICLKAKAFLDWTKRKADGEQVDDKQIKKHKGDVFRLSTLLAADDTFELPDSLKADLQTFANTVKNELPDKAMFKEMGLGTTSAPTVFTQLMTSFGLNKE
jgi:hypothetical protein